MFSDAASIACDPPLGSITTVGSSSVLFNVAINTSSHVGPELDVQVWHQSKRLDRFASLPNDNASKQLSSFQGILENHEESPRRISFTLKIIVGEETNWVKDIDGLPDGVIIFKGKALLPRLDDYLRTIDSSWITEQAQNNISLDSKLWVCHSTVKASKAKVSSWNTSRLVHPFSALKWFALVRHSTPWLGPRHGNSKFRLDKPGILASFLQQDGSHLVVLPVNGIDSVLTVLESDDAGNIIVKSRNDKMQSGDVRVIIAVSKSFEQALAVAISQLKVLLRTQDDQKSTSKSSLRSKIFQLTNLKSESKSTLSKPTTLTAEEDLDDWHDGFSYCTWNSLGHSLSETKILSALSTLSNHGVKITNLIIDDNWQSLDTGPASNIYHDTNKYRWTDFHANKENFPNGLAHLTQKIRAAHPRIHHIAVWHGLFGYWGGISPSGSIAKRYKTTGTTRQTCEYYLHGGTITVVSASDVGRLYSDFYAYLAFCGVDAVKTDTQFYPYYIEHAPDRAALIYAYQDAWLAAVGKHFAHRGIACMAQPPQILFHSFLSRTSPIPNQPAHLVRNSDDFSPETGNDSAQAWHLFCNAHNAVLTRHLNILPDWDIFQTSGPWAGMHAAARCLSGGPVYVTGGPGEHDLELIKQMTGLGRRGRVRMLRLKGKGRAVDVYEGKKSRRFLRIGNAHLGTEVLGLFNLGEQEGMEIVTGRSFVGVEMVGRGEVLVTRYVGDEVHVLDGYRGALSVVLQPREFEILTGYPITSLAGFKFVVLGLLGKMTGVAALSCQPEVTIVEDKTLCVTVSLKALGVFGVWLENASRYLAGNLLSAALVSEKERLGLNVEQRFRDVIGIDLESVQLDEQGGDDASRKGFEVEIRIAALVE